MTMYLNYPTKKDLKEHIGAKLSYQETSMFGNEYLSTGTFIGCNRPSISGMGRAYFAKVTMTNDIITKVE